MRHRVAPFGSQTGAHVEGLRRAGQRSVGAQRRFRGIGHRVFVSVVAGSAAAVLAACGKDWSEAPVAGAADRVPGGLPATDAWIGRWNGPEGTFLRISGGSGAYRILIQDLDGQTEFIGTESAGSIEFERRGQTETIRETDGAGTGMKWLADKHDCLVIVRGDGYCRD